MARAEPGQERFWEKSLVRDRMAFGATTVVTGQSHWLRDVQDRYLFEVIRVFAMDLLDRAFNAGKMNAQYLFCPRRIACA